ncbi:hypothetical protein R1sor_005940 [Riccia sorocarpa]|uniref:SURP motif domain-containing protein n=1 Tax=Riccia sorocarpa TaxID=122646 RepID=A0ABD3HPE1_9MARC
MRISEWTSPPRRLSRRDISVAHVLVAVPARRLYEILFPDLSNGNGSLLEFNLSCGGVGQQISPVPTVMPRRESLAPLELKQAQGTPRRQCQVPKPAKKTPPVLVSQSLNSSESPLETPVRAGASGATLSTPTRRGEVPRTPARAGAGGATVSTPTRSGEVSRSCARVGPASLTPTRNGEATEPPAEIRCIVDKTAEFVAQNGVEFEQQILSNEKRNPKYNFLKSKDIYHLYYQRRILDFIDQAPPSEVGGGDLGASAQAGGD